MALTKEERKIKSLEKNISQKDVEISKLKEELDGASRTSDYYEKMYRKANEELEEAHATLDLFPNSPARNIKTSEWSSVNMSLSSRIAGWLSSLAVPQDFLKLFPPEKKGE